MWVLLLYRSFLLLYILVTYLLILFRYILALVHVYYIIHFVGDLVNISDNSLIFNWQPFAKPCNIFINWNEKKKFRNRLYLFPWAKYPIFLNIKSPKQKQKNKTNSTIFFYFSSSNIAKQIFLRICLINSNVNIVVVVHMPLSNLNMSISKYKILYS